MDLEALFNIIYKHLPIINQITDKDFKIPAISHHIWLTNYQNPKEIRDSDLVNLKRSLSIIDTNSSSTWQHILWTNCKSCIPKTIQQLKLMDIKVRDFVSIKDQLISYDAVSMHIHESKYGIAADLLREDLVNLFGGFYSDLNYVLDKTPESLMKKVDFFADSLGGNIGVENYMFASAASHPILKAALTSTLDLIRNLSVSGIDLSACHSSELTDFLTFKPFVMAFIQNANKYGTIDLAIPHSERDEYEYDFLGMCFPEQENDSTADDQYLKIDQYFRKHLVGIDMSIGKDGTDGGTWLL